MVGGKRYLNEATRSVLVKTQQLTSFKLFLIERQVQISDVLSYQDFDQHKLRVLMHFNLAALVYPAKKFIRLLRKVTLSHYPF